MKRYPFVMRGYPPSHTHNVGIGAVEDHLHTITVAYSGGAETRPQNIAFLACIKY